MLARRHRLVTASLPIAALLVHLSAPPAEPLHEARIHEPEEDDHEPEGQPAVQRRTERHRVLGPPPRRAPPHHEVERVAHERPHAEVEPRRRRDPAQRPEQHGQVDLAHDAVAPPPRVPPQRHRRHRPEQEAPHERPVGGRGAEELVRPDDAPEDGAVEVDARERAREAIQRVGRADTRHVREHPVQHGDLRERREQRRGHLHGEERARRDLHVVPELEVRGELDALRRRDVAVGHEDHVGDGAAGEERAAGELADEVDGGLLVGDGGDDADGDEEEGADGEGEEEAVPGEMDGVAAAVCELAGLGVEVGEVMDGEEGDVLFHDEDPDGRHGDAGSQVPPHRRVLVLPHEPVVHVLLVEDVVQVGDVGVRPMQAGCC